ncbi:MAG: glycerol-3-phosphate dehydrogenase [Candidatus Omnitrophota bacterium]|nr:MAG: glycerol-3-phosphate dehydrogenase [Candidatus Omnitrophota bacterium]
MGKKIGILGAGGWGTTLSILLNKKGYEVILWEVFPEYAKILREKRENIYYLPGIKIPSSINITSDIEKVMESPFLIIAIPSRYFRDIIKKMKNFYKGQPLLIGTKGLEIETGKRMSEIVEEEIGKVPLAIISGPTIAREIAKGFPAAAVVASKDKKIGENFQKILSCDNLRLYTNKDVAGVELGGALKNVIAIGAGIIDGLKLGTNTKASYITRGLKEMVRIGKILGGKEKTFWGLSGMGDLITTCFSPYSRNRSFGQAIVEVGKEEYLRKTKMAIEGIYTTKSIYKISKKMKIETPIIDAIYRIVFLNKEPKDEIKRLMRRRLKEE